MPIFI